jgi:hypothetical protein
MLHVRLNFFLKCPKDDNIFKKNLCPRYRLTKNTYSIRFLLFNIKSLYNKNLNSYHVSSSQNEASIITMEARETDKVTSSDTDEREDSLAASYTMMMYNRNSSLT